MFADFNETLYLFFFFAKKILSLILYPLGLALVLIIVALAWRMRKPKGWLPLALVVSALILLYVASIPLTSRALLSALDKAAGDYCTTNSLREQKIKYVVVMAGALVLQDLSIADRWGSALPRVMEGIRLASALPETVLLLSGGCLPHICSDADAMSELPIQCGIQPERIVVKVGALDTAQEARMLVPILGTEPFALVTSFTHVPRATRLFRQCGANPVSCPCERYLWVATPWYRYFLPDSTSLKNTTQAMHEYMGMVWTSITLSLFGES